jgi:hypothetical protein
MAGKGITYFWRKGWGSAVIILACLGYLLSLSWMKWGDFIIDSGREMYVPLRLISGGLLYRDIFYTYGPFSPYFNALLYMLSGPHLSALVAGGILAALLACFLFFKIARFFLDVFFSTIATLTFLFILAFGHYYNLSNYNFVLPYSYPATHALLFSLMAFYFLFRWLNNVRRCNLWLFGTALFFTLLARIEIGLFVILAALVMKIFSRKQEKYPRFAWKYLCLPLGLALAVYMFFLANSSVLQSNLFDIWRGGMSAHNVFTSYLFGLDRPWENLAIMFKSALYFAVLGIFLASGALLTERLKGGGV